MPYTQASYPYRVLAQLHAHTNQSDGALTPSALVAQYAGAGYDALAITDHDKVTSQPSGVSIPIQGNEPSFGSHVLSLGCSYLRGSETNTQNVLNGIAAAGGASVVAHPLWGDGDTPLEELRVLSGELGIEIHNAHCVGHSTTPNNGVAVDLWDTLLRTQRRDLWGVASDDFHAINDHEGYDIGRLIVWPQALTGSAVLDALRAGDFAADVSNYGVTLNPPSLSGDVLSLSCPGASRIRFLNECGLVQSTEGDSADYTIGGCEWYVRAEVIGKLVEAFDAAIDQTNRWGVRGGTWGVSGGLLAQTNDTDNEQQIILKRHLTSDWTVTCDVMLPSNGQQEQVGLLFNAVNHDACYYWSLRGASASYPNTLSFWCRNGSVWPPALVTVPFTPSPNTWYRLKVTYDALTKTFRCACWLVGQSEPSPQVTIQHTQWTNGAIGLRTRRKGWFDNLTIDGFTSYFQPIAVRP